VLEEEVEILRDLTAGQPDEVRLTGIIERDTDTGTSKVYECPERRVVSPRIVSGQSVLDRCVTRPTK
jgi:hypothetical protein